MSLYDKKILYLDYLENGRKIKNAGFAKVEVRDECCRILLNVKSTYDTDSLRAEVVLLTDVGEIEMDHFMLIHGMGTYLVQLNVNNMADSGITYEECAGLGVRLSEQRIVQATWRELLVSNKEIKESEAEENNQGNMKDFEEELEFNSIKEEKPESIIAEELEEKIEEKNIQKNIVEKVDKGVKEKENKQNTNVIYDDKWKQLCHIFQTISPFKDERKYLSITPSDFVVLTKDFQPMVNNSFLLHGFYNYKHIILGKDEKNNKERYYIGVPGVYYDREKQVALMFGFESFDSQKEQAEEGEFGYYLKTVDI